MFNYLRTESGKITLKVLATLLVITLTFANFILLGTYLGNGGMTYAADENSTDSPNVFFNVYLKEDKTKELTVDMNSDDLNLHVYAEVKNQGELKDAKLKLENANFKLIENSKEKDEVSLGSIKAGSKIEKAYKISLKKDSNFDLNWLNTASKVRLTGTYSYGDKSGNKADENINATKDVTIKYNAPAKIGEEDNANHKAQLESAIITNTVFDDFNNSEPKRVIQQLVTSQIVNNSYPIKSTNIEVEVPKIEGEAPESVKVATYGTAATNGEYSEFGTVAENKKGSYNYDATSGKITITVNNTPNSENKVSWEKDEADTFVITYVYSKDVTVTSIQTKVTSNIKIYTYVKDSNNNYSDENYVSETVTKTEAGNELKVIPSLTLYAADIYNGNMRVGNDTEYKTMWLAGISDTRLSGKDGILIGNAIKDGTVQKEQFLNAENAKINDVNPTSYYKATYIDIDQFNNILGENGEVQIFKGDMSSVLATINKDTQKSADNKYYVFNYETNEEGIQILFSKPVKEGIVTIINDKVLKSDAQVKGKLNNIKGLATSAQFILNDGIAENVENYNSLVNDTELGIGVGIDNKKISATEKTERNITITLKQDNFKYELYKNPTIKVEFPSFIKNVEILDAQLTNANGLILKPVEGQQGVFNVEGSVSDYTNSNPQLSLTVRLEAKELVPTSTDNILVTITNGETEKTKTAKIPLTVETTPTMITRFNLSGIDGTTLPTGNEQKITGTATAKILNNTGGDATNATVIGKVVGDISAQIISLTAEGGTIEYTADKEVKADSNWTSEKPENVTGYKIVYPTINDGELKTFAYTLELPIGLEKNKSLDMQYSVIADTTVSSEKITLQTPQETKLELKVEPVVENNAKVYEGQTLSYKVSVKNIGNGTAKNIKVTNILSEGLTLVASNEKDWTIDSLEAGATDEKTLQATVNNLPEGETTKTVKMQTKVEQEYLETALTNTVTNEVNKAPISVKFDLIEDNDKFEIGKEVYYAVSITNNTGNKIEDLKIENEIPKELEYLLPYVCGKTGVEFIENNNTYSSEGIILNNGETILLRIDAYVMDYNEKGLTNSIKLTYQGEEGLIFTDIRQMEKPLSVNVAITSDNANKEVKTGDLIEYTINVKNDNDEDVSRIIKTTVSEGLEIKKIEVTGVETIETSDRREYILDEFYLISKSNIDIKITAEVTADAEEIESDTELMANVLVSNKNYISNSEQIKFTLKKPVIKPIVISIASEKANKEVKTDDIVEYLVSVKNENEKDIVTNLKAKLSNGLEILRIEQIDKDNKAQPIVDLKDSNEYTVENIVIPAKTTETYKITANVVEDEKKLDNDINLTAEAEVVNNGNSIKSNIVSVILKKVTTPVEPSGPQDPTEPSNPEPNPNPDPNPNPNPDPDPNPTTDVYTISGKAWLDENKDGKLEDAEKAINGIIVKIKDAKTNEFLKDNSNNEINATTGDNGEYKFENLKPGKYIIVYNIDLKTYGLAKGNDTSAVIATENDETIVKTDTLEIKDKNIENINIGLVENPKFDLKLDKYVTKITVQNEDGTTTYDYDKSQLAKVEISSKKMAGSVVLVEYTIDVTNNGEVPGTIDSIVDYVSPEYTFNSEINENWYQGTDNNLYTLELANEPIKPGETKSVKLILSKIMTNTNTGLVSNTAEIQNAFNDMALVDINSIPGNGQEKENDMSGADLMVSVKTGGPVLYIGIIIASMLILGGGIYLVNKKVIAKQEI